MRVLLLLLIALLIPEPGIAATPEEAGLAIATEAHQRDRGWSDLRASMRMTLRAAGGEESLRELRVSMLEVEGDGDKSLILFDSPRDIAGTAFLSHTHALAPDDQWLYLPALKRVKRIAASSKSGPFMGSEFAYEDLTSNEVEKYRYRLLREESLEDQPCFVLEERPAYENSGYTRRVVWLDKARYQPLKVEFYDRKDTLLKTLLFSDYSRYLDTWWRAGRMQMANHQSGKQTELLWRDFTFKQGLGARDFDLNTLKR